MPSPKSLILPRATLILSKSGDTNVGIYPKAARSPPTWFRLPPPGSFPGWIKISSVFVTTGLRPAKKNFLRAIAELGPGAHRTGDIADTLGIKVSSLGPVRAKLIRKGMIYSPAHGDIAFTVPLFDEFMRRAIPVFQS